MAIQFLNTVDLNFNQLDKAVIQNLGADPAVGALGQIYFDSSNAVKKLKVCTTASVVDPASDAVWTAVGNAGDITEVKGGTYISVTDQTGPVPEVNHDDTTRTDTASTASPAAGATFTAVDSVTTNTTGHVTALNLKTVTLPADTQETYTLPVSVGTAVANHTVADIDLTAAGAGSGIKSRVTFAGKNSNIAISETVGNNGVVFVALSDSVVIQSNLEVGGEISQTSGGNENSFASELNMNSNKITSLGTATEDDHAVNLGQVNLIAAGIGVFQGGYNATNNPGVPVISGSSNIALTKGDYFVVSSDGNITFNGTTTTGVNNGALANSTALLLTAANTTIAVGMAVVGAGVPSGITIATITNSSNFVLSSGITIANTTTLTFSDALVKVEVGDFIFVNADITADSDPAENAYTFVRSDANIAGAGATDGATEKGVAGFDSAQFTVTANGFVQSKNVGDIVSVTASTVGNLDGLSAVTTSGATVVGLDIVSLPNITGYSGADLQGLEIPLFSSEVSPEANVKIEVAELLSRVSPTASLSKSGTITAGDTSGTVAHTFGQLTMVQTFDAVTGATVYCDIVRDTTSPYTVTASVSVAQTNAIKILVQSIRS